MAKQQEQQLKASMGKQLSEMCVAVRHRRRLIEEQWLRNHRMWMSKAYDRSYAASDSSTARYTIPQGRRSLERSTVRIVKMLTPNVKWFEISPIGDVSDVNVANMDNYLWYVLRKRIKTRTNISQLARTAALYGRCHLKTSVSVRNGYVWPSQRAVDPFSLYIFPETATTCDDWDFCFEDFLMSYDRYMTFVKQGVVEAVPRSDLTKPEWPYHMVERLAHQGLTDPTQDVHLGVARDKVIEELKRFEQSFLAVTELWLTREDSLYQVYIVWNCRGGPKVTGFFKSDYYEPLYKTAIHRPLPNESYTNASADDIAELDSLANDQLNKFQEAVDWEQGIAAFNDSVVSRKDTLKMKGRAKWEFSEDPRLAVQLFTPQVTSVGQLRAWQIYLALINSLSGAGTIAEGQPGRNMPRAGFAVNTLISLGMSDVQDVAEIIEQEVLTPSLSDIYKVSADFIPDHQLINIPKAQSLFGRSAIIKREQIVGDYEFEWIGAQQFQDENLRAQRLMIFANILAQPTVMQMLQQQGYAPNMVELLQTIWRSGIGERGLQKILVPLQELQQILPVNVSGNNSGVPGLSYTQPTATNGFVQQ